MKLTDEEIDEILDGVLEEESQKEGIGFDDTLLPDTTFFAFARKIESEIEKRVRAELTPKFKVGDMVLTPWCANPLLVLGVDERTYHLEGSPDYKYPESRLELVAGVAALEYEIERKESTK